ncbi:small peptidoglycan-associated lipoprotein [Neobacillus sp. D3-1R]|uniref:small peptidoglycan-associated lipoprotein n=1 Tax=Neobacillus sp. D3-1R TaxID=3445778 RepID=UPI003FA1208B
MKGLALVSICTILFFIASCNNHYSIDSLSIKKNVKQIVFFTDEANVQVEAPYYDAIIELRKDFPEEIKNMMVLTKANGKKYYESFKIKSSPAIVVIYNNQIVSNINGKVTKDQIVQPTSKALEIQK